MRAIFLGICTLLCVQLSAQDTSSKLSIRFGVGRSLLGSGDIRTTMLENEINYRLNSFFATAASIGYGKSNELGYGTASFFQGNANVFFSPFRNTKTNDFRMGGGLTYYDILDSYLESAEYVDGELIDADYNFDRRQSAGFTVIIENTFTVTDRFLVGLKVFTQPYFNGDINSGIMLKTGVKL